MSEAERIFHRDALLGGKAAALSDIKQAMRDPEWRKTILTTFASDLERAKANRAVFEKIRKDAAARGISEHEVRSFIAGYSDTMTAFALMDMHL